MRKLKIPVCLVGPFIGELSWEYFRFAPYIIHVMKANPTSRFIVFTRPDRFDFYGSYVDIFVPLNINNDRNENQSCFTIKEFPVNSYNSLIKSFVRKYREEYKIVEKIYPDIEGFSYKIKWQFPRSKMDYDFTPRTSNYDTVNIFMQDDSILLDCTTNFTKDIDIQIPNLKKITDLSIQIEPFVKHPSISQWGCYIEAIKKCKYVIGNLSSDISRMSLLLKKPLITVNEQLSNDSIHLINPLETPIIKCIDVEEGIKIYEDNF